MDIIDKIKALPDGKTLLYAVMTGMQVEGYNSAHFTTDDLKALVAELEKYQTPCTGICGYQAPYGFVPEADCPIHDKAN